MYLYNIMCIPLCYTFRCNQICLLRVTKTIFNLWKINCYQLKYCKLINENLYTVLYYTMDFVRHS